MRRMDRYQKNTTTVTRRDRNEELYKELNSDIKYANVTDVTNTNAYEITNKFYFTNCQNIYFLGDRCKPRTF